uniref:8-amino-7-oxononanoate synthase n=1 Tax=Paulinella chromatophora TaxID=39717 RepID=B1X3W9_PAUCH|nr:putative 8-amino-7-oxononanoate synthase [Paulinella chromatophora]ACB42638.1 putative 8-amino-7-oxononanoate synthase [Paulinella chromatophora]
MENFTKTNSSCEANSCQEFASQEELSRKLTLIPKYRRRKLYGFDNNDGTMISRSSNSKKLLDLASNDYLNLSRHKKVEAAASIAIQRHGVGASASRLISGTRSAHLELESALSYWLEREHVLLFPSGFQANLAGVQALANRHTLVIADRLVHHSLLAGIRYSGAQLKRFVHNNLEDLERQLKTARKESSSQPILVISESLFSMEGTSPDLLKLTSLCKENKAKVMIDEAHALGVLGLGGRGLAYNIQNVDLISGTLSKAFGSSGGFIATNHLIGNWLLQTSGAFRYSTALAPALTAAALASLALIQEHPYWGEDLCNRSSYWRRQLEKAGWPCPLGIGPIIPVMLNANCISSELDKKLEMTGLVSALIRPPTIPHGQERLRLILRRGIPTNTLSHLLKALVTFGIK